MEFENQFCFRSADRFSRKFKSKVSGYHRVLLMILHDDTNALRSESAVRAALHTRRLDHSAYPFFFSLVESPLTCFAVISTANTLTLLFASIAWPSVPSYPRSYLLGTLAMVPQTEREVRGRTNGAAG
ncbi:hypothetical protein BDN67DRAFT_604682, partial [Paxillus ammoniavirescens]